MKKIFALIAGAACWFSASAAEIKFLETYDQLSNVVGQEGHWFVRDAAGTKSGQHGDPTVQNGWAIYTWNLRRKDGSAGWTKICEEESLDASTSEILTREFARKDWVQAQIDDVKSTYTSLVKHAEDINAVNGLIQAIDVRLQSAETTLTYMRTDVSKVQRKVTQLTDELVLHEAWAEGMSNNVLTAAKAYTDSQIGSVTKDYVDTSIANATNDVLRQAKDYTDHQSVSKTYVAEQVVGVSNNVITIASTDATSKANQAKNDAVAEATGIAKTYTDELHVAATNAAQVAITNSQTILRGEIAAASNNVLTAAIAYTDSKAVGTDTNAVLSLIKSEKSNYATNIADSARSYNDYTIGRKKFELGTTNNFNVTEWTGTIYNKYIIKPTEPGEEPSVSEYNDLVKLIWRETWLQGRTTGEEDPSYIYIPVSNVWSISWFDYSDGTWVDWGMCVSGRYDQVSHTYKFFMDFDYGDSNIVTWTGFTLNKTQVMQDTDEETDIFVFDIKATIPEYTIEGYLASDNDLKKKRDINDLVIPAYTFVPDESINFGCSNFVGTLNCYSSRFETMTNIPMRAQWCEYYSYWDSDKSEYIYTNNVWNLFIKDEEYGWGEMSSFMTIVKNATNAYDVTIFGIYEKTNMCTTVSSIMDMKIICDHDEEAPEPNYILLTPDMGDHDETRIATLVDLESKRDRDDFIISQEEVVTTELPFNITNWYGTLAWSVGDVSVNYLVQMRWDEDDLRWNAYYSEDGGETWDHMYRSYITGEYDETNKVHRFAAILYDDPVFEFTGINVHTNITIDAENVVVDLNAQPGMMIIDRIAKLSDLKEFVSTNNIVTTNVLIEALKAYVTTNKLNSTLTNYATKKDIQDMGGGKVSDLFFAPISTTNENFGVMSWVGKIYEDAESSDGVGIRVPIRADWDTTNKLWKLKAGVLGDYSDLDLAITGRYDQVNKNFEFTMFSSDEIALDVSISWKNFYCDVPFTLLDISLLNCRIYLVPENTSGERLQTDRDTRCKRDYSDLSLRIEGFEPDVAAQNFGVDTWVFKVSYEGLTARYDWTTNEVLIGSTVVSNCWISTGFAGVETNTFVTGQRDLITGEYKFKVRGVGDEHFEWTGFNTRFYLDRIPIHVYANGITEKKQSTSLATLDDLTSKRDYLDNTVATSEFVVGTNGNFGVTEWTGHYSLTLSDFLERVPLTATYVDTLVDNNFTTNNCWVITCNILGITTYTMGFIAGEYDAETKTHKFNFYELKHHIRESTCETECTNVCSFTGFHCLYQTRDVGMTEGYINFVFDAVIPKYEKNDRYATENYIETVVTNAYRSEKRWNAMSQIILPNRETATIHELWDVINSLVEVAKQTPTVPFKSDYAVDANDIPFWNIRETWIDPSNLVWNAKLQLKSSNCWETAQYENVVYQLCLTNNALVLAIGSYNGEEFVPSESVGPNKVHDPIGAPYIFSRSTGDEYTNTIIQISAPYTRFK